MEVSKARSVLGELRKNLNSPTADAAAIEKVNQDFTQFFPRTITDVKVIGVWIPIIHADPFNYIDHAALRAASVTAFRRNFKPESGLLEITRKQFVNEAGGKGEEFDAAVRALQGHPPDKPFLIPKDNVLSVWGHGINRSAMNFVSNLALTGSSYVNAMETVIPPGAMYFGIPNYLRSLAKTGSRDFVNHMELRGEINREIYNNSFDPTSPIGSIFRIAGNQISRWFARKLLNEVQERSNATIANVAAERIKAGELTPWEQEMFPETMRQMGFTSSETKAIMAGDPEMLQQMTRKAAAFLTGGNKAIAENSYLGMRRLFNSMFRFHSYPMMKVNQLMKQFEGVAKAQDENRDIQPAVRSLVRWMFGTAAQGVGTVFVTALFKGGPEGAKLKAQEAVDSPLRFMFESTLAAIGGPVYVAGKALSSTGFTVDLKDVSSILHKAGDIIADAVFPISMTREFMDMLAGNYAYKDMDKSDKLDKFLSRFPGPSAVKTQLSIFGLSERNVKLEQDIKAFRKWKVDTFGYVDVESNLKEDPNIEFRTQMKKAVEAIKHDKSPNQYFNAALRLPKNSGFKQVAQSLRGRKLLKNPLGGSLTQDQVKELHNRIGVQAYDRVQNFDNKLEEIAKAFTQ